VEPAFYTVSAEIFQISFTCQRLTTTEISKGQALTSPSWQSSPFIEYLCGV